MRDAVVRRRRRSRRHRLIAAGVAVAVLGVGGTAFALRPVAAQYRTATVAMGDVAQQVAVSATVASASRADTTFGTSGTVATVDVTAGDHVEAGDVLAALDADELQDAVDDANETLAEAEQTLADDLEAQESGTSSTTSVTSAAGTGGVGASSSTGGSVLVVATTSAGVRAVTVTTANAGSSSLEQAVTAARAALTATQSDVQAAQGALLAGYESVESALLASTTALDTSGSAVSAATGEHSACAALLAAGTGDTSSGAKPSAETDDATSGDNLTACVTAILAAQEALVATDTAQQTTGAAQTALRDLVANLDDAVTTLGEKADVLDAAVQALVDADTSGSGGGTENGGSGTPPPGTGSDGGADAGGGTGPTGAGPGAGPSQSTGGSAMGGAPTTGDASSAGGDAGGLGGDSSGTITAERILADRAAVTVAERQLEIAEAAAAAGTLTAPIAGTVAQVDVTPGASVGTSDAAVTILGDGGYVLTTTLDLAEVGAVEVGQVVTATVPATSGEYTGTVSNIGILNDSQTSTPSYAATVVLDTVDGELPEGASASAKIAVAAVSDVLVVPTSTVTTDGSERTVRMLDGDGLRTVTVTTGAVGPEVTEVTDGLAAGDEVVLADLTQQLVFDDEDESSGLTGLGGSEQQGGPQGGFPEGGFPRLNGEMPARG